MTAVDRLLATARAEIGYHEKASNSDLDSKTGNSGSANYTKYARDLDALGDVYNGKKQGYDWCDVFVDWCFIHTFGEAIGMKLLCQPYKGLGAGTKYSMQYYQQKGQFHKTGPQPGDQIFFGSGTKVNHTGIVERVTASDVYTIEGNTSGSVMVAQKSYPLKYSTILGYGRPDWNLVHEPAPTPTPGGDNDMLSYEQWKEYMERYRKELQAKPGSDWSDADRNWAIVNGIINGGNADDGYMWQDFLTREQAAAMLHREARRMGNA